MLSANEIAQVKGMLQRGDKQQDIAAYFKTNAGRIAEISGGKRGSDIRPAPQSVLPKLDTAPRYIDPNASLERQTDALMALVKNPPENSRRVTITPALAEVILTTMNTHNRPARKTAIARYAKDMADGQWRLTGDTIKFGRSGLLRDGQHRLAACIRSGVPFETFVVFGIDDLSFSVIDTGRKRKNDDAFAIAGIRNASTAAAATRWVLIFTSANPADRGVTFSNDEMLSAYRGLRTGEFDLCVADAKALCKKIKVLAESALAALLYLFRAKDPRATEVFLNDLVALKGPAKKLVVALDEMRLSNMGRVHETVRNAMIIRAWRAYADGKGLRKADLMWNANEPFPEI